VHSTIIQGSAIKATGTSVQASARQECCDHNSLAQTLPSMVPPPTHMLPSCSSYWCHKFGPSAAGRTHATLAAHHVCDLGLHARLRYLESQRSVVYSHDADMTCATVTQSSILMLPVNNNFLYDIHSGTGAKAKFHADGDFFGIVWLDPHAVDVGTVHCKGNTLVLISSLRQPSKRPVPC
jgi:hypothetical protein